MIKKIRTHFMAVLPLVYDDTLSYYEQLCKFADKLNEVIDNINNFHDEVSAEIDAKIAELKVYVDEENEKQDLAVDEKIQNVYEYIQKQIELIYQYVDNGDSVIKIYVNSEIEKLKKYVDDAILGDIIVYDPTTGYKNKLCVVLEHIYDTLRYYGITCYNFDGLKIDSTTFDNKNMTAIEFDTLSLCIIGNMYSHYIFNPLDGNYDTLQRVLYAFFQYVRQEAITANGFDIADKTVNQLSTIDFTAIGFDETGKTIIPS